MNRPIDILFVGEAPGQSEDICGKPFVGRAGQELDEIIQESLDPDTTYIITNAVLCTPYKDETRSEIGTPTAEYIKPCSNNLHRLYSLVEPRVVVALGRIASSSLKRFCPTHATILHPSAILQSSHYNLEHERAVLTLKHIQKELNDAKEIDP